MNRRLFLALPALAAAGGASWLALWSRPISRDALARAWAAPLPPLTPPLSVYHLGHSLVGRDMPAMLAQLLPGHAYHSQLGWGASLKQHWQGDVPGFVQENRPPAFRPAGEALDSGTYDAVILTEMVEIRDAIRWHDSARHLARWAARARTGQARAGRPDVRLYLYETWHRLDDPEGWLTRIDRDLSRYWEDALVRPAMARRGVGTIHVIPGGQVMAALARAAEAGHLPGLTRREDLFARAADGSIDPIHLNDLGAYAIALTHAAVLTQQSPPGLPQRLTRADGTPADAPSAPLAAAMQRVVWDTVRSYAGSGIPA